MSHVAGSHLSDTSHAIPFLQRFGCLPNQWRHFKREHPITKFTHVFVLDEVRFLMGSRPRGAALVVMRMLAVMVVVRTARHHVTDLVHLLQPHDQRLRAQLRNGCETR